MKLDGCMQEKCSHCPLNQSIPKKFKDLLLGMCPVCRKCGAPKHKINPECSECLKCENGEGYLRGNLPDGFDKLIQSESYKEKPGFYFKEEENKMPINKIIIIKKGDGDSIA